MIKYKHILLAIDFSKDTTKIAKKAVELATIANAKLSMVHVVEPLPGYGYAYVGSADVEMQLMEEAKKQMAKLARKYDVSKIRQYVEFGPTTSEITRVAQEKKADLIVVGSHGYSGWNILLGSTANGVLHHAHCDVLIVRLKS